MVSIICAQVQVANGARENSNAGVQMFGEPVEKTCQAFSILPKAARKLPTSPAPKGTRKGTRALRLPETAAVPRVARRTRQAMA